MVEQYEPFDVPAYLDSEEVIAEYLNAAAKVGDLDIMLLALAKAEKARERMAMAMEKVK